MNTELVNKRLIFLGTVGSHAYGTSLPESDYDEAGCCIPTKDYYIGNKKFEQANKWVDDKGNKIDKTVYSFDKIIDLCLDNNPNCLDLLFLPDRCIKKITKEWERVMEVREKFLSKKCKHTFSGYAFAQLERIQTHRSYLLSPVSKPSREQFGLPERSIFPDTQNEVISKLAFNYIDFNDKDSFYREVNQVVDNELMTIFRKYLAPEVVPFIMQEFKKGQTEYLRTFETISSMYLKEEYVSMAAKEMKYLSAYKNWKRFEDWRQSRNPKRQELEAKCGYDCYSSDTEFLTENGWKKFDDISKDEKLATVFVNWSDRNMSHRKEMSIEYQNFQDKFDGIFNGEMYHFNGNHLDILVTPNHNMLIRKYSRRNEKVVSGLELMQCASLADSFQFLATITPNKKNYCNGDIFKNLSVSPKQFLSLMGWFLSDGTICFGENGKPKSVRISQIKGGKLHNLMSRFYSKLKSKIRCSLYSYERPSNDFNSQVHTEIILDVRDNVIVNRIFDECGHSKNKRIPRWVFSLSKSLMETLFDGMRRGDGTIRNTSFRSFIYYSSSKELADDVQELAFLCGWETSLYGPYTYPDRDLTMYQVHVNKNVEQFKTLINRNNISKVKVENHRIVCFTVPNSILITRRNGHVAIQGNSKHASHLIRLERMGIEILSGYGCRVDRTNIDAEELLNIRLGNVPWETVLEISRRNQSLLDSLYAESKLPNQPDRKLIELVKMQILEQYLFRN